MDMHAKLEDIDPKMVEFSHIARFITQTHMEEMCNELERIWGSRVHMAVCVIPIDSSAGVPAGVLISDTMGSAKVNMEFVGDMFHAKAQGDGIDMSAKSTN